MNADTTDGFTCALAEGDWDAPYCGAIPKTWRWVWEYRDMLSGAAGRAVFRIEDWSCDDPGQRRLLAAPRCTLSVHTHWSYPRHLAGLYGHTGFGSGIAAGAIPVEASCQLNFRPPQQLRGHLAELLLTNDPNDDIMGAPRPVFRAFVERLTQDGMLGEGSTP